MRKEIRALIAQAKERPRSKSKPYDCGHFRKLEDPTCLDCMARLSLREYRARLAVRKCADKKNPRLAIGRARRLEERKREYGLSL